MSMKGILSAEPDKLSKRRSSTHKRNSGELDVFEAAVYFSGYNEASFGDHRNTQKYGNSAAREENRRRWGILGGGRRISLDLPIRCSEQVHHLHQDHHEVTTIKERLGNVRHKQPSSPGGRIASFLNSLFHQAGSKKNKLKSKTSTDREVEEETPGGGWMRRRRRSSISHFLSSSRSNSNTTTTTTTTSSSSKSMFSSSSSGFRTPPPYLNTPTKNYNQFLHYTSATNQVGVEEAKNNEKSSWLDEKLKVMENHSEKKKFRAENDDDDDDRSIKRIEDEGMESDSSSDLFELQNYELSRGGLPVYETTNVANINKTHI